MRTIGTEMMTFGAGLPVLYFVFAVAFLNGPGAVATLVVSALSFLLIGLGHQARVRAVRTNR